jgi:hypothetical protein
VPSVRWQPALVAVSCILAVAACSGPARRSAAEPVAPRIPGEIMSGPDLTGVQLPNFVMPLISGGVSLPKTSLTPGAVTTTNADNVCASIRVATPSIPYTEQLAIYDSYGYTNPIIQKKYVLDFLVPASLGGATTQSNIWPISVRGTGFYQKEQLDHILKDLVCRRYVTLARAQHALETNWYAAWLKYVVATGHF